jgi:hypothetical protein
MRSAGPLTVPGQASKSITTPTVPDETFPQFTKSVTERNR